ncbi:MAG: AMP-binding protein [Bacteroidota bacterium]
MMTQSSFHLFDLLHHTHWDTKQLIVGIQRDQICSNNSSPYLHFVLRMMRALLNHEVIQLRHDIALEQVDFGTSAYAQPIGSLQHLLDLLRHSKSEIALSTSGTTGQPQWYTYSVASLLRHTRRGSKYRNDRWLLTYHPAHMGGIQVFLQALFNHNPIFYAYRAKRQQILAAIESHQISHLSGTPTFYRLLLPMDQNYPSVQRLSLGGERFPPLLINQLRPYFPNAQFNNIYASTETGTLFISHNDIFQLSADLKDKVKEVDGLLYLHCSLLNPSLNKNEWHATGDYIEWVDEQCFRIVGKKNEWINVAGYRVHLPSIETKIKQLPGIQDCRLFCRKSSLTGKLITCKVQVTNKYWTVQNLKTKLRELLPPHQLPRIIEFVEELPMGHTGKAVRI